jgi:dynein heavy chain
VEDGLKHLHQVVKFFKDRNVDGKLDKIMDIATKVKAEVEDFKPKVPLLVALRTKGMNERHWKDIREKSQLDIKP